MAFFSFSSTLPLLWQGFGAFMAPVLRLYLTRTLRKKGDDASRIPERYGIPSHIPREFYASRHVLWIHAASVGETRASFPLIDALLSQKSDLSILFTTTTATGARICAHHPAFGARLQHQFIPYDTPLWVTKFLNFWSPSGAVFIESELWPGIIAACKRHAIPTMVANARLSDRSFQRWHRIPSLFQALFCSLSWVSPRSCEDRKRFEQLGFSRFMKEGDIKEDSPALSFCPIEEQRLRHLIGSRRVFVAASTHEGEEEIIAQAVQQATIHRPDMLAIIVPRHPERGPLLAQKLAAPCRSAGQDPSPLCSLWIADTLDELGLFFQLATHAFVGHSLCAPGGGHNPLEPLRQHCLTATGPYMGNWRETCQKLAPFLTIVHDSTALAQWLASESLFHSPPQNNKNFSRELAARIIDTIFTHPASL